MTSTAETLLEHLKALRVTVRVDGDKLRLAPAERIPPETVEELRASKTEVLSYLKANCLSCVCPANWWKYNLALSCAHCEGAVCADCGGCLSDRYRKSHKTRV